MRINNYSGRTKEKKLLYHQRPEVRKKKKAYDKIYHKTYYQNNKEIEKIKSKRYYHEHREKIKTSMKEYVKIYYKKHKDKIKEYYSKQDIIAHRKKYMKDYKQKPEVKIRLKEYNHIYRQKVIFKKKKNIDYKKRYNNDNPFNLQTRLRRLLNYSFRRYLITGKIMTSIKYGIDYKAIIEHLKPFPENIKEYHIDHIIPLSRFDFNNIEHINKAFTPTNHQWLTIKQNIEKGNKLIMPHVYK